MPKRNGFFMVSNRIFDFGLTPRTFAVYCCLRRHKSQTTNDCWPSRETIARMCRCTRRTVDKALHELCDIGLVKKEKRYAADGRRTSNLYTVCDCSLNGAQGRIPHRASVSDCL